MKYLVVFASGTGSNFQSIINAINNGQLQARIAGLITNNPNAFSLHRARENTIPATVIRPADFETESDYEDALLKQLHEWKADLIILAGYLKKIPARVIGAYPDRILNIHPALLPKYGGKGFYGINVHNAVIKAGEKESGCTVHLVNEEYDDGQILGQATVPVEACETPEQLAERILQQEHKLYPAVIQQYIKTLNTR